MGGTVKAWAVPAIISIECEVEVNLLKEGRPSLLPACLQKSASVS